VLAEAFALGASEAQRLVDDLLEDGGTRRFSVHLAGPEDAGALLSLQVAADVFQEAFGNTADLLRSEYAELLPTMTHLLVLDRTTRTAVGSLILQEAPAEELKTLVDLAGEPWSIPVHTALAALGLDPGARTAVDQLLLAVHPAYRKVGMAQLLMYAGWLLSVQRGFDRWTAMLDAPLLHGMNELTQGALIPIAGAATEPYLGSPASTPVSIRMDPAEDVELLRRIAWAGAAAAEHADFCAGLGSGHRSFQARATAGA
jgi:ribosomal protein S18 acetylase RimI-like enzyme